MKTTLEETTESLREKAQDAARRHKARLRIKQMEDLASKLEDRLS